MNGITHITGVHASLYTTIFGLLCQCHLAAGGNAREMSKHEVTDFKYDLQKRPPWPLGGLGGHLHILTNRKTFRSVVALIVA